MGVKQFGNAHAIAWNESRFRKLDDGIFWVARDQTVSNFSPERFLSYVRLQDRATGKTIFAANHHGPLNIDTGGLHGPDSVASNINNGINGRKRSGDIVILGGDFNAGSGFRTMTALRGKGYRMVASEWVDHILTNNLNSSSSPSTIDGTGSDHKGVKVRWTSF